MASAAGTRPNILYLVADDLGYSDIGAFGGEIHTPNLDQLAKTGRVLTNFHTAPVCAVTRSMLYTGTDHHLVGEGTQGAPSDERKGQPGYEGYLNDRAVHVAQLLKNAGYHTYIAGKWHLGSDISKGQTPDGWGFEHSYVLLGGATTNHFGHEATGSRNYASDGQYVQPGQPGQPGGDGNFFFDSDFYASQLIQWIDEGHSDGKPFIAYATFTAPHWPLQAPDEYINRYKGWYDVGYDVIRKRRLAKQKALGISPSDFTPNPGLPEVLTPAPATANNGKPSARYINARTYNDPSYVDYGAGFVNKKWNSLSAAEKKTQARYYEIYAAQIENLDHNIGRLIQHLKDIGEYDNTFIVFHSDNGAEGSPISAAQETINQANYDKLGRDYDRNTQYVQIGRRWAEVSASPLKLYKATTGEGGVSAPAIVHLPGQTATLPPLRDFAHLIDSTPTLLALAGVSPPSEPAPPLIDGNGVNQNKGKVVYDGRYVYPIIGSSLLGRLEGTSSGPLHTEPVGEEFNGQTYLHSGSYKALWLPPPALGPVDGHWQLYNVDQDRGEVHDLSAERPEVLNDLIQKWNTYLDNVGGILSARPTSGGPAQ
jgi:arylsulfatase